MLIAVSLELFWLCWFLEIAASFSLSWGGDQRQELDRSMNLGLEDHTTNLCEGALEFFDPSLKLLSRAVQVRRV